MKENEIKPVKQMLRKIVAIQLKLTVTNIIGKLSEREKMTTPNMLWASRKGTRQYLGENERGAKVEIGMGQGQFTPGELFKLALATCQTLSADHTLASKLGQDFNATVVVTSEKHETEERYTRLESQIITDLSNLTENELEKLLERVKVAIDKNCTIGHTLEHPLPYKYSIEDE